MAFSFAALKNIGLLGIKKSSASFDRREMVFLAFLAVLALGLSLLIFDGYLFYETVTREPVQPPPAETKSIPVSGRDIDEVIQLLYARDKKFNDILNVK